MTFHHYESDGKTLRSNGLTHRQAVEYLRTHAKANPVKDGNSLEDRMLNNLLPEEKLSRYADCADYYCLPDGSYIVWGLL